MSSFFKIQSFIAFIIGLSLVRCGSGIEPASEQVENHVYAWAFVDGGGATGINLASSHGTEQSTLAYCGTTLYAAWLEGDQAGTASGGAPLGTMSLAVSAYNGDDSNPVWTPIAGYGVSQLNFSSSVDANRPVLGCLNSKLYVAWDEGSTTQIRVSVFTGTTSSPSWTRVDGGSSAGINYNTTKNGKFVSLVTLNSKLYASWVESISNKWQVRVALYNGNDNSPGWSFVDGNATTGLNYATNKHAYQPHIVAFNSKLYLTWYEDQTSAADSLIHVRVYNGNDSSPSWSAAEGPGITYLNAKGTNQATVPLLLSTSDALYITFAEKDSSGIKQMRVKKYNGNDSAPVWQFIDGGTAVNSDTSIAITMSSLFNIGTDLYAFWEQNNSDGINLIKTSLYSNATGADVWTSIEENTKNTLNKDVAEYAHAGPSLPCVTVNSKAYCSWREEESGTNVDQVRVIVRK